MPDIHMDDDDSILDVAKRICTCGHTLMMHGFTMTRGGLNTSICISCNCKKFQDTGIIDDIEEEN